MAGQKKRFPCGHVGRGQYCHRCQAAEAEEHARRQQAAERAAWQATFATDAVDLRALPNRELELEARDVLAGIGAGRHPAEFGGKRISYDRTVISVPLSRDYRIMFRDDGDSLAPIAVMSHETYNKKKPGER
jgi:hypothetical protein